MVPPAGNTRPDLFAIKVIGGSGALIIVGLVFHHRRHQPS